MRNGFTARELISDPWKAISVDPNNKELQKELLTLIFNDSMNIIDNSDDLKDDIMYSIEGTIVSNDFVSMYNNINRHKPIRKTKIEVHAGRTIANASQYARAGKKVAVLNFASATSPGGKVTDGSNAQEESICRISTLYPVLTSKVASKYYSYHKKNLSKIKPYYTNTVIYSPEITVFKSDNQYPDRVLDDNSRFHVDVITSAAPNLINQRINYNMLEVVLKTRIDNILAAAAVGGADVVVLGAFGCGVFKNPPELVARCFKEVIESNWSNTFEVIHFAIINDARGKHNLETFKEILE